MSIDSDEHSLISEEDENNTEDIIHLEDELQGKTHKFRRNIAYQRAMKSSQAIFYLKFLVGVLVVESYFLTDFLISRTTLSNFTDLVDEFQTICECEPFYLFLLNSQREYITGGEFPILQQDSLQVIIGNIGKLY